MTTRSTPTVTELGYPLRVDDRGRFLDADPVAHVEQMLIQLLLTAPGERLNRPDFGCGLRQRVFDPDNPALASSVQFDVTNAIQRWLGDVLTLHGVSMSSSDGELVVTITYALPTDDRSRTLRVKP